MGQWLWLPAGRPRRPTCLVEKQAAAVGQSQLIVPIISFYALWLEQPSCCSRRRIWRPRRSQNARNVLRYLLRQPIIPSSMRTTPLPLKSGLGDNDGYLPSSPVR